MTPLVLSPNTILALSTQYTVQTRKCFPVLLQYLSIPDIFLFWFTATLLRPVKSVPKKRRFVTKQPKNPKFRIENDAWEFSGKRVMEDNLIKIYITHSLSPNKDFRGQLFSKYGCWTMDIFIENLNPFGTYRCIPEDIIKRDLRSFNIRKAFQVIRREYLTSLHYLALSEKLISC